MSSIIFSGLATGLDTGSIVSQLVELKRRPIYRLQQRREGFQGQIDALSSLREKLLALQTAARDLDTASEFMTLTATSSLEDILQATVGSGAAPGTYDILVTSLAKARKESSQGFDSPMATVGTGSFTYTVGGRSETLTLASGTTLEGLRDAINAGAEGISASIINDGSATGGYRLVVSATETGSVGDFSLDLSGLTGPGALSMTERQAAADAVLNVDGIAVTASSNQPTDLISGLTLDLRGVTEGTAVTLRVEMDDEAITGKVKALVDAYNDLAGFAAEHKGSESVLRGNGTLRMVSNRINSIFGSAQSAGSVSMFSELGIDRTRDGQLEWDADKFNTALNADFGGVRDFFIKADGVTGKGYLLDMAVDDMTDSVSGLFKISTESLNSRIKSTDLTIERYERTIESYRINLERRFAAMEIMVSRLRSQGNYLNGVL
jgi:flagellar hook-associated protein 2